MSEMETLLDSMENRTDKPQNRTGYDFMLASIIAA